MGSKMLSFHKIGDCVLEPYYSDALGEMVTGPRHRRDLMRAKGLEEA